MEAQQPSPQRPPRFMEATTEPFAPVPIPGSTPRRKKRSHLLILLAVLGLIAVAVAVTLTVATSSFAITGSMTLFDTTGRGVVTTSNGCTGAGGYDDIGEKAAVTIRDDSGKTVAQGRLGPGAGQDLNCTFPFTVDDVPSGSKFYEVEVSHRGGVVFSRDDLDDGPVKLSLG